MSTTTTRVRIGQYDEQGTHCKHCGATYRQCTIDVLRDLHDPEANDGCCDECRDSSGHEVSAIPDPARSALLEIRVVVTGDRSAAAKVELIQPLVAQGLGESQ